MNDRSNLIRYVENPNQRFLLHYGEGFLFEKMPKGTRIVYPPKPFEPLPDARAAVERAVENPLEADPLSAQLKPGMKATVVFDDLSLTLPPMRAPDFRQTAIELIVEKLTAAGVSDIHLIAALGLHRRMTPKELKQQVGTRIFNQFHPSGQLYNHDAEDADNMVLLGKTEQGEHVELHRRAVESDIVIYVNLNLSSMDGGHKSINTGIASYRSLYHHHNPNTLNHTRSLMDPTNSQLHDSLNRMGKIVNEHMNVFHIESTYNTATFTRHVSVPPKARGRMVALRPRQLPPQQNRRRDPPERRRPRRLPLHARPVRTHQRTSGRHRAGTPEITLQNIFKQQAVPVDGQCDILIAGTPYIGPYNVNSILNPLLVHCLMLGYMFNLYRGKPLVREGGALILAHPLEYRFHEGHHPSYIELFDEVLPHTTDMQTLYEQYEPKFAKNPKYIQMYREQYAYHGAHALYMWYWGVHGRNHLGKVIVLKPQDRRAVEAASRMGYDTADSMEEAVEKATSAVGTDPSITNLHWPPLFVCDVA